jgi:hypothetical protein
MPTKDKVDSACLTENIRTGGDMRDIEREMKRNDRMLVLGLTLIFGAPCIGSLVGVIVAHFIR